MTENQTKFSDYITDDVFEQINGNFQEDTTRKWTKAVVKRSKRVRRKKNSSAIGKADVTQLKQNKLTNSKVNFRSFAQTIDQSSTFLEVTDDQKRRQKRKDKEPEGDSATILMDPSTPQPLLISSDVLEHLSFDPQTRSKSIQQSFSRLAETLTLKRELLRQERIFELNHCKGNLGLIDY